MQITTIGLDIAKNVFQVHGIDGSKISMTFNSIMRVARYLGKGEVVSSILTGSTTKPLLSRRWPTWRPWPLFRSMPPPRARAQERLRGCLEVR